MAKSGLLKYSAVLILAMSIVGCSVPTQSMVALPTPNPLRWLVKESSIAPDFGFASLSGAVVDSSQYRGRPILVHFWATWCQPCRDESKRLQAAEIKYRANGFEILAITNETDQDEVAKFAREQNLSFPILFDPNNIAFDQYRVTGLPTSFLIDANGIVRQVAPGPFTTASLELALSKIFSSNP